MTTTNGPLNKADMMFRHAMKKEAAGDMKAADSWLAKAAAEEDRAFKEDRASCELAVRRLD